MPVLAGLAALNNLVRLELRGVPITDAAVPQLARFTQLRELDVAKTGISATGLADLKKALPQAKIASDAARR